MQETTFGLCIIFIILCAVACLVGLVLSPLIIAPVQGVLYLWEGTLDKDSIYCNMAFLGIMMYILIFVILCVHICDRAHSKTQNVYSTNVDERIRLSSTNVDERRRL